MAEEDDLGTSLAHLLLCGASGYALSKFKKSFVHLGMHFNLLLHGILGLIQYQSKSLNMNVSDAYKMSLASVRYMAIPCLIADLYSGNQAIGAAHILSGMVPLILEGSGNANPIVGNVIIILNIISLYYFSIKDDRKWGWWCTGASRFAYFAAFFTKTRLIFPIGLAMIDVFAHKLYTEVVAEIENPRLAQERQVKKKKEVEKKKKDAAAAAEKKKQAEAAAAAKK